MCFCTCATVILQPITKRLKFSPSQNRLNINWGDIFPVCDFQFLTQNFVRKVSSILKEREGYFLKWRGGLKGLRELGV